MYLWILVDFNTINLGIVRFYILYLEYKRQQILTKSLKREAYKKLKIKSF